MRAVRAILLSNPRGRPADRFRDAIDGGPAAGT
jgi:hypothetical protein